MCFSLPIRLGLYKSLIKGGGIITCNYMYFVGQTNIFHAAWLLGCNREEELDKRIQNREKILGTAR